MTIKEFFSFYLKKKVWMIYKLYWQTKLVKMKFY